MLVNMTKTSKNPEVAIKLHPYFALTTLGSK